MGVSSGEVLDLRALNRALLQRQMLLARSPLGVAAAIERLVGRQAQQSRDPYIGLWSRLDGFRPEQLEQRITARKAVRIALMRSTIHLVSASDCLALRAVVKPAIDRELDGPYGQRLAGLDLEPVIAAGRAVVEERPRTTSELGATPSADDGDAGVGAGRGPVRFDGPGRGRDARRMMQLEGKVAVITGAASGIGLAMARRFAAEKMKLVLLDIDAPALAAAEAALRDAGAAVLAIPADVSSSADLEAAADRAQAAFGTLHLICNNAGVGGVAGTTWSLSEADWDWLLSINLRGVINGVRVFLPPLLASGEEGHIVNTSSMAGLTSTAFMSAYTVAKHGVVALSEVLAKELELTGARVGVSVLCPGFVKTQIHMSERNRQRDPSARAAADLGPEGAVLADAVSQLVESGQAPEVIAGRVLGAVREGHFYVLTHPEMKPAIQHRMRDILEERAPGIDPISRQLAQRRSAAGPGETQSS